ncbi:acyl-CoA-like ligand-binding transcription factor [Actinocatenispora rupis]|uniref:TetR family transcriptional regulator n=1 Tax=Actinocatenispora rupis TaxID=519421 RepID=A0A8J3J9A4_9ACTN|nr:TetR family transcriptional regulator [Actinocatenispora rupis]GID14041.1 TetR family transcriptional regulator [Actinocatenispora rupis]
MDTTRTGGLRERKKEQTRAALSWAALRLTVERGFDNVKVEDIATEAGVSPRTYNNYFSSKAEAIVWRHLNRARQAADVIRARPADEPLWDAVTAAVLAHAGSEHDEPDPEWTAGVRLMMTEPALLGEMHKAYAAANDACAEAIAERIGADPHDMYPRLVAGAVGVATQLASELWLTADPPVPLAALLRDALDELGGGLAR